MKRVLIFFAALVFAQAAFAQRPPSIPAGAPVDLRAAQPNYYNFTPTSLPKFRAAYSALINGSGGNVNVAIIGDSTDLGYNSTAGATMRLNGVTPQLSQILESSGIPSGWQNWFGQCAAPGGLPAVDSRVTLGTGWTVSAFNTLCERAYLQTAAGGALTVTPTAPVDTFDIYYISAGGGATFNAQIDAGTATAINSNHGSSPTLYKSTVTASTVSTHSLSINWVSGGNAYIIGVDAYASTRKQISLWNLGWYGSQASDWNNSTNTYSPLNTLKFAAPALTIIRLGINDACKNTEGVDAFIANGQAIINAALATGDVILATVIPTSSGGSCPQSYQSAFYQAIYALAKTNGLPLIDITGRFGSQAKMAALGFYSDTTHLTTIGYGDVAQAYAAALRTVLVGTKPQVSQIPDGGVVATGNTLATAKPLTSKSSIIISCPTNAGVQVTASGQDFLNASGSTCNFYPLTSSASFVKNGTTIGAVDTLASGGHVSLICPSATLCYEAP